MPTIVTDTLSGRSVVVHLCTWTCHACPARGLYTPGLPSFWAHWAQCHKPRSIFHGVVGR